MIKGKVFVTGGAGYIGSHTCVELLEAGYEVVVYDNLSNSKQQSLDRVQTITKKSLVFIQGDIRDEDSLEKAMIGCDSVIHFAGLKSVGESVQYPDLYVDTNIRGTGCVLRVMSKLGLDKIVFSSSATVYGDPLFLPISETHPLAPTNPYGQTKSDAETLFQEQQNQSPNWKVMLLRYFNPVGAHQSGLIGEDPSGIPNNLMPYIAQVAVGRRDYLQVFGNDYDTLDGTGVRDYIHVVDLAKGHLRALECLVKPGCDVVNLGTGKGYSVLELISAFEKACRKTIPYKIVARRPGDIATCYADVTKSKQLLNWQAELDIHSMCEDVWRWQFRNPGGYSA
jgi:UDP-glucose 4-epimerase